MLTRALWVVAQGEQAAVAAESGYDGASVVMDRGMACYDGTLFQYCVAPLALFEAHAHSQATSSPGATTAITGWHAVQKQTKKEFAVVTLLNGGPLTAQRRHDAFVGPSPSVQTLMISKCQGHVHAWSALS